MHRNSLLELSSRVMSGVVRLTMNKANDNPMMQELSFDGMMGDARKIVERVQAFGISTMPLPRDDQKGGGQQGAAGSSSGGAGTGDSEKGPAAEGIAVYVGAQRNHPVVIAVDDRRHRPMGLKPGESAQYDDQGMMTLIRRGAIHMLALDDNGDGNAPGQYASKAGGEKKERYASIRHVVKKKQDRQNSGNPQTNLATWVRAGYDISKMSAEERAEAERTPNHEDYKHEGDEINTEMRTTAKRIEFRSGDSVVGYYDKGGKTWCFIGKVKLGSDSAQHPVYGVNGGVGMTSDPGGSDAVLINAPKPGPPTSMDGQPFEARDAEIEALKARVAALEARINHGE